MNKASTLIGFIIVLGVITIGVGLYGFNLLPNPSLVGINQVTTNASGQVDLVLSPASVTSKIDEESTLTLTANVGNVKLVVLTVEMTYDPAKISTPVITQREFLSNTLASAKAENGKITFAFAASPESGGVTGNGTVATIKFHPLSSGNSVISFSPSTTATGIDLAGERIPSNTLRSATDATIVVAAIVPTETTTPTPTSTSTPTPTQKPSQNEVLVVANTPTPTTKPRVATTTHDNTYTTTPADSNLIPISEEPARTFTDTTVAKPPSFFKKIMIGWGIIIQYILSLFGIK